MLPGSPRPGRLGGGSQDRVAPNCRASCLIFPISAAVLRPCRETAPLIQKNWMNSTVIQTSRDKSVDDFAIVPERDGEAAIFLPP